MTAKDQLKLIKAGFTILRRNVRTFEIKFKGPESKDWCIMERCYNKIEMDRQMKKFLNNQMVVEE